MAEEKVLEKMDEATTVEPQESELEQKLSELGVSPELIDAIIDHLGVETVEDLSILEEADLLDAGMKIIQARKLLKQFKVESAPEPVAMPQVTSAVNMCGSLLPEIPSEESWLADLKTGGILRIDRNSYISAIRAALAERTGIFEVPKKLVDAMEVFALENQQPVTPEFYELSKQLTRRSYGEIFAAVDGIDGTFVTEKRKKELFRRLNEYVWPVLQDSSTQFKTWYETWVSASSNPASLAMVLQGLRGGTAALPPGMGAAPDTSVLRDLGDGLREAINKALAGVGTGVAAALAYDYTKIRKVLEKPDLPAKVGATNREQLFKKLGLSIDSALVRTENNIVRYILGLIEADSQPADLEAAYFGELYMLSTQINWRALGLATDDANHGLSSFTSDL